MTRHPYKTRWKNHGIIHERLANELAAKPRREIIFTSDEWREIRAFTMDVIKAAAAMFATLIFVLGLWAVLYGLGASR